MKPVLLDLFCGAGGCARGYQEAGFYVVGCDIKPQPRYVGDAFIQADALEVMGDLLSGRNLVSSDAGAWQQNDFAAFHASPPCQGYSQMKRVTGKEYPMLIEDARDAFQATNKPYVIENVIGAPLDNPIMLCGSMFGLRVYRHRLFEINPFLLMPPHVPHRDKTPSAGRGLSPKGFICVVGNGGLKNSNGMSYTAYARKAMGIDWMTRDELSQAIPPAYTRYIGEQLMRTICP
jgi:DNA (cytosine-5)-methyltransferase 1